MQPRTAVAPDGTVYRDLNANGRLDPFEDHRLPTAERVEDLLGRLSLAEKAGLMFHTVIEAGQDGELLAGPGRISKSGTAEVVLGKHLTHFNVHALPGPRLAARWANQLQLLAEQAPHGVPVTISTDPRHGFFENAGASFAARGLSQWPEPLGLAALRDPARVRRFAEVVNAEYRALGIRAALHPTVDLATEPRWARQAQTFGQDPELVGRLGVAYLEGLQQGRVGPTSVACTTKHFPGGGPQAHGEDAHFPYGREQVYPAGRFADHLRPFRDLIAAGTSAIMPYYGMPVGLEVDGEPVQPVGFGYNARITTRLLRDELGFDGVVCTDWELVNDNHVGDQVLPARAWGVEHLDPAGRMELILAAGADQFGGEECVELLVELVTSGRVPESRLDASARRLLAVKFDLGLFDNPFVDEDEAARVVGSAEFMAEGRRAQAESVTVLTNNGLLPLTAALPIPEERSGAQRANASRRANGGTTSPLRVYAEGFDVDALGPGFEPVASPEQADVAIVRLAAPFEPRSDLFLEAWFHQGSLDFPPGLVVRLRRIAAQCPLLVDVTCDRPAVLTPLRDCASALTVSFGTGPGPYADAVTGRVPPRGRLPFDLPRSMDDVRAHPEDRPGFDDPLFAFGHGLTP
jgi:beta-glucosidase